MQHQESALAFIDEISLLLNCKPHMLKRIKHFPDIATKRNMKLVPGKPLFMLFLAKYLGYDIDFQTNKKIHPNSLRSTKLVLQLQNVNGLGSLVE